MKFVCQSCGREFDIGAPKGMQLPCPACGGMMSDQESAGQAPAAVAPPPPAEAEAPAAPSQEEFSLDAAEAFLKSQSSAAPEAPAPSPAPVPPSPAPSSAPPPPAPAPAPAPIPAPAPVAVSTEPAAEPSGYEEQAVEGDNQANWPGESASAGAAPGPYAGGVTAALDAAVAEGYYDEEAMEEEGASPLVLILGWVLFGVAIVGIGVMAFFLKTYHVQLKEAGDPAKLKANNIQLNKQLVRETENSRALAERRDELVAENDKLTLQVTDLKGILAKAKAERQADLDKLAGLDSQLKVSEGAAKDLKEKLREIKERGRRAQADGTQALSQLLSGRHALRSIEFLERPARWGEALAQLNKAIRADDTSKEARWLRGALLVKLRRPKEAVEDFETLDEFIRKDNAAGHIRALVAAGDVCRTQLDDKGRARDFYRSAAKAGPDSPFGKLAQAQIELLGGHPEQARAILAREVKVVEKAGEDYAPFCVLLAEISAAGPDGRDEAIRLLTKAIVADPANARALDLRAGLLLKMGRIEQAAADLLRAKEIDPFGRKRLAILGDALADLRRYEQAEIISRKALEMAPASAEARVALGKALVGLEKYEDAIEIVSPAAQGGPKSGEAHHVRGQAYIALNNLRDGLRDLEAALRLRKGSAQARILLARTYATARGTRHLDPEKALSHARVAVDLTNRLNAEALAALAVAYAANREFAKAAGEMRQAFALAPNREDYRKLLAEYERKAR